ncbi:hypothetical protein OEG84_08195 [Hoeflea sp. G2-23]|uniref:Uncharacterized protein n=1 Tax=Hoeflea algicola TaxID=2983763 RepID=A0ABT3Z7D9_9HYPH|nr:hypothetical protein [Hoeflea algicola]MCY0147697.1 hypothetical protein [Hoeflea algicola]
MTTLARRFIIVCLIFVIFALLMAAAVANSERTTSGWHNGAIEACTFRFGARCN